MVPAFQRITDYERLYRRKRNVCGKPYPEIARFFRETFSSPVRILDLGCGQGRDALVLAGLRHHVTGMDVAPSGITALRERAAAEGLADHIRAHTGDMEGSWPEEAFQVILMDRVLNMLPEDARRQVLLERALKFLPPGGYLVAAVTAAGIPLMEGHVGSHPRVESLARLGKGIYAARVRPAQ